MRKMIKKKPLSNKQLLKALLGGENTEPVSGYGYFETYISDTEKLHVFLNPVTFQFITLKESEIREQLGLKPLIKEYKGVA